MKTLKPSNLQQAKKELQATDKKSNLKIDVIEVKDKDFYHVIMVSKVNNPAKQEYVTKTHIQMFNVLGYEKIKKSFAQQGYSKIILLHDPSKMEKKETGNDVSQFHKSQIEREIEIELQKEMEEKKAKLMKERLEKLNDTETPEDADKGKSDDDKETGNNDGTDTDKDNGNTFDITKANDEEIKTFAEQNKIQLGAAKKPQTVKKIVSAWIEENKK